LRYAGWEIKMKFQSIAPDVKLGENVKLYDFVNLYGCEVGDDTKIGCFVEIQKNARIGRYCKISSHTFICEGVVIEDNVFIGHNVTFINDKYPRATNTNGELQTEEDWVVQQTMVKNGASVGSGATILPYITIGENAIVGAGSVVTKDVPPNTIVAGNPARILRLIGEEKISLAEAAEIAEQQYLFSFVTDYPEQRKKRTANSSSSNE
jgi:UDP-2-acetamido-3-amino-2,3-dideoxy-glucuronate N-acetyltransferase